MRRERIPLRTHLSQAARYLRVFGWGTDFGSPPTFTSAQIVEYVESLGVWCLMKARSRGFVLRSAVCPFHFPRTNVCFVGERRFASPECLLSWSSHCRVATNSTRSGH